MKKRPLFFVALFSLFVGLGAVTYNNDKLFEVAKNIEIFANIYKELNTYYVDELDPSTLMKTAIDGMLKSLDPYTNYFSESQLEAWRYMTEGKYEGIGANVKAVNGEITVIEPYEGCPAYKAGLRAGDVILSVNGQSTKGKETDDLSPLLRGVPGSTLVLEVRKPGETKIEKITLTRDEINISNTPYFGMAADHIGYIILTTFTQDAGKNVASALKSLKQQDPKLKGVILDLRNNGGGLLSEAVNVSNVFLPKGVEIVSTRGKVREWDKSYSTNNQPTDDQIPLVVLINKGSASASEIVSGSIQDYDRGVLIGQRSYGKGLVQNTKETGFNSRVKITTSKYYIPSGRCIQSVSYHNGEPLDVPDGERSKYKTKAGRTVLDGGGVTPDIYMQPDSGDAVIKALINDYVIFNFATDFKLKNNSIATAEEFVFNDFNSFLSYLDNYKAPFLTQSERDLNSLEDKVKSEELLNSVKSDFATLKSKLKSEKRNVIIKNKERVINLISREIASRYYSQSGKILNDIRHDHEVKEAVKVLNNPTQVISILASKK